MGTFGRRARAVFEHTGGNAQLQIYSNYAHGDEPTKTSYRREPWRLEKLRALKSRYDPNRVFGFYQPLPTM